MDRKTDSAQEFGLLSGCGDCEYGHLPAAADFKTNPAEEFSRSPDGEDGEIARPEEDSASSDAPSPQRAGPDSRRARHRRTLLLQMAAVGLGVVLVANSFGKDLLGSDALFRSSSAGPGESGPCIIIGAFDEESLHRDDYEILSTSHYVYRNSSPGEGAETYADTVTYDPHSNTLYLRGADLDVLVVHKMGQDFTLYVEETSQIGLLDIQAGSLTVDADPGELLIVNQKEDISWWHGIILYGKGQNVSLTVQPNAALDVFGHDSAIAVDNSTAECGILYNAAFTILYGQVESGSYPFEDGMFEAGGTDWSVVDDTGALLQDVVFIPNNEFGEIGGDPSFDSWPYVYSQSDLDRLPVSHDMNAITGIRAYGDAMISDLGTLSLMPNLTEVEMNNNLIRDLGPLAGLSSLSSVRLSGNPIRDLSPLAQVPQLRMLMLSDCQLEDLSPLSGLQHLTELYLDTNFIGDLSPLARMPQITELFLRDNSITDLTPLSRVDNLQVLYLDHNSVSDLSPLSGLGDLRVLLLNDNAVSDLSPLAELKGLQSLQLCNNPISDLTPLKNLTGLTSLYLTGCSVTQEQVQDLRDALPDCNIVF